MFEVTTQHARLCANSTLKQRFKSPFPHSTHPAAPKMLPWTPFSDTPAVESGAKMAQCYCGTDSLLCEIYEMHSVKELPNTLEDNIREHGAPNPCTGFSSLLCHQILVQCPSPPTPKNP